MLIDLFQLRTFVAVAEEQHLTRAADRLHISQSSASAHVRAVEESLDTRLFVRANRSLELTRAGHLLFRKAKTLLGEASLFTSFARELRGRVEGNLVVGTSSEEGTRIGQVVAAMRATYPMVSVDLRARPSSGARQGLVSGELDLCVLLGRGIDPGFIHYHLATVRYRIAGPAAWKEQVENADWGELAELPWIAPSRSTAYAGMLEELFTDKGLELNSVVHFDNAALGRALLHAGVGMMLIRAEQAEQAAKAGILSLSPIGRSEVSMSIAHQATRREDPLIKAFVEAASIAWPGMKPVQAHNVPINSPDGGVHVS